MGDVAQHGKTADDLLFSKKSTKDAKNQLDPLKITRNFILVLRKNHKPYPIQAAKQI